MSSWNKQARELLERCCQWGSISGDNSAKTPDSESPPPVTYQELRALLDEWVERDELIELDPYERVNLRWALERINDCEGDVGDLNSGDWVMQLAFKLQEMARDDDPEPNGAGITPPAEARRPLCLIWGEHDRNDGQHTEWYAPCGCAYHPEPKPHVHQCEQHGGGAQ